MIMTIANQIAALARNDGTCWLVGEQSLDDIARERGAIFESQGQLTRMVFPDGSAIVECADIWDIEGSTPYSFSGMEESQMITITIQNIAGGDQASFRTLTGLARFVAQNPVYGGYEIVGSVTTDSDREEVLAVIRYAESARRKIGRNDWPAVVEQCVRWSEQWSEPDPEEDVDQ